MEAPGAEDDLASPASSTGSLDLRRLSTRADSAYSSFSAASGGPEMGTPPPGPELLPYLDWGYVREVWGGGYPALRGPRRPGPVLATHSAPQPPDGLGSAGRLSRQATPLLYALAAEAKAEAARTSEPPSPPAARAAYRQRLQGAQRRVLRETSFQRRELRMSLPARLRPPALHLRSASLGHATRDSEPVRTAPSALGTAGPGQLATQRGMCCFSEPGKLHRLGCSGGPAGEGLGEACSSSRLPSPDTQDLQRGAHVEVKGLQESQSRSAGELDSGSTKPGSACRPAGRSQSTSGVEVLGLSRGSERTVATVQAVHPKLETPGPLHQTKLSRFLTQKEASVLCPAESPGSSSASCKHRASETCTVSTGLPSLPDCDDVFLEETLLPMMKSPRDSCAPQRLPHRVSHVSNGQFENGLSQKAGQPTISAACPGHECPGSTGADDYWEGSDTSVGVCSCGPPAAADGDIPTIDPSGHMIADPSAATENDSLKPPSAHDPQPAGCAAPGVPHYTSLNKGTSQPNSKPAWPSRHFEELVQELARLDPSLSDTLASQPSPEPTLGLLDGLIPSTELWAGMRAMCEEAGEEEAGEEEAGEEKAGEEEAGEEEAGEEAAGASKAGSYGCHFTQQPAASQEVTRPENSTLGPAPEEPSDQGPPTPNDSTKAKKVQLAGILQKMLQDLHAEQERLQGTAATWARGKAALEAAVSRACASRELERFCRFIADLERVLGLLLLLGSRLARVHFALARAGSDSDPEDRASLLQRLHLLQRQQENAKELKELVARRERALREVLERALSEEHLHSYCVLLATKAKILSQQLGLDERIRLLQNQLETIQSDLTHQPLSPRLSWSPGICSLDRAPSPAPPI